MFIVFENLKSTNTIWRSLWVPGAVSANILHHKFQMPPFHSFHFRRPVRTHTFPVLAHFYLLSRSRQTPIDQSAVPYSDQSFSSGYVFVALRIHMFV